MAPEACCGHDRRLRIELVHDARHCGDDVVAQRRGVARHRLADPPSPRHPRPRRPPAPGARLRSSRPGRCGNSRWRPRSAASAFWACPPSSMVATQVVRVWPTYDGLAASAAAAASSFGLAANFAMACPSSPGVVLLDARKLAMVVSFHMTGKLNCAQFHERRGQIVDGVVGARRGAVPARIARGQLEIRVGLLGGLQAEEQRLAGLVVERAAAAVGIQRVFGVDERPMFVCDRHRGRHRGFFVAAEVDDEVALRDVLLRLEAQEQRRSAPVTPCFTS